MSEQQKNTSWNLMITVVGIIISSVCFYFINNAQMTEKINDLKIEIVTIKETKVGKDDVRKLESKLQHLEYILKSETGEIVISGDKKEKDKEEQ